MKKTFELIHPKIKYARLVEGAKNDVRKYIRRERRRELPEGADFWDFDCRFGDTEAGAKVIHPAEINDCINDIEKRQLKSFYMEILAKTAVRKKKQEPGEEGASEEPPAPVRTKLNTFGGE